MALTKPGADLDLCHEIAAATVEEGVNDNIAADYDAAIHLQLALTDETAHTGTRIILQVNSSDAPNNRDWVDEHDFTALIGTANSEVVDDNPLLIGATTITISDTTGYVTDGAWLFLKDITDFANSEWVQQKAHTANVDIDIIDGTFIQHLLNSTLYNVAQSHFLPLPFATRQVRLIFDNFGNSTIAVRSRIVEVTAVS